MQSTLRSFVAMIQTLVKYFFLLFILCFGVTSPVSANTLEHKYDNFHSIKSHKKTIEDLSFTTIKFSTHFSQDYPLYTTRNEQVKPEFLYFESESKNKNPFSLKKHLKSIDYFTSYFYNNSSISHNISTSIKYVAERKSSSSEYFYLLFLSIIV